MNKVAFVIVGLLAIGVAGCSTQALRVPNHSGGSVVAGPRIVQSGSGGRVFIQLSAGSGPIDIAAGPQRTMWITENTAGRITSLSLTTNAVREFALPNPGAQPYSVAQGPDSRVYFTERAGNAIGAVTLRGGISEYPLTTANAQPLIIAPGKDGNMWFSENGADQVGRITPTGSITEYPVIGAPWGVAAGPDGNEWFTDNTPTTSYVGKITPSGVVTEYPAANCGGCLTGIAPAKDGKLYFLFDGQGTIGQITHTGAVATFAAPNTHFWLAERPGNFGRVFLYTPACCSNPLPVYHFDIQTGMTFVRELLPYQSAVDFLANGVDGNIYYVEHDIDAIVVSTTRTMIVVPNVISLTGIGSTQTLSVSETEFSNRPWHATTSDASVATVAQGQDASHFVVTAQGAGSCTITIADTTGNSVRVPTTVTP